MKAITLERTGGAKRARLLTLIGIALVPVTVGGVLLFSLQGSTDRLHTVTAAIVNEDAGVTIDGQTVPLGRQLAGDLVRGSKSALGTTANYTWVLTKKADAASGLNDGRYTAVVTIPKQFSAAATSYSDPDSARQATIQVATSDTSRLADGAISTAIADSATEVLGRDLTKGYLANVYVGFNTLHTSLGKAATGAKKIADGLDSSSSGTAKLAAGQGELASGTAALATGLHKLADGSAQSTSGTRTLATGASSLASGTSKLAGGLKELAGGARSSASGADALASGSRQLASGAEGVASGVQAIAQLARANPDMTLAQLDAALGAQGSSLAQLAGGASGIASGAQQASGGTTKLADGLDRLADGATASAQGARKLADGTATLATGARKLATGSGQITDGIDDSATGADKLASGGTSLRSGLTQLASGSAALAKGQSSLASGLDTAVEKLPTYSKAERTTLAAAVAQPVAAVDPSGLPALIRSGLPLLVSLALWMGALAIYLLLQAATRRALTSSRSSLALAAGGYLPGLVIGALQGLALAVIAQVTVHLEAGPWFALAGFAMLAGASFAAVVQGMTALLGGVGRFLVVVAAVLTLATSLISSAPPLLVTVADILPTASAATGVLHVITGTDGVGGAVVSLILWGLLGLLLTTAAIARRRTVGARGLQGLAVQ